MLQTQINKCIYATSWIFIPKQVWPSQESSPNSGQITLLEKLTIHMDTCKPLAGDSPRADHGFPAPLKSISWTSPWTPPWTSLLFRSRVKPKPEALRQREVGVPGKREEWGKQITHRSQALLTHFKVEKFPVHFKQKQKTGKEEYYPRLWRKLPSKDQNKINLQKKFNFNSSHKFSCFLVK